MAKTFLLIIAAWMLANPGFSADEPKKRTALEPTVKSLTDGNLEFAFKVIIPDDLVINKDAPWKLVIKAAKGLAFTETTLGNKTMKPDLPGFIVTTKERPGANSGVLEYSLVAFSCTKSKDNCFRDVHAGTIPWKAGK